jgi:hypothetical protein
MQNSFAGELSLQQWLRDITNFMPGSLNLDWCLQFLLGYHLRKVIQLSIPSIYIQAKI